MSISKEDWGVTRVEKELKALEKRLYRGGRRLINKRLSPDQARARADLFNKVIAKRRQLHQAKLNWQRWVNDPEWQVAISEMVCGISQAGLCFES